MHAPLSPAYRVEWRALATLRDIADEWRTLAARALEPNVFYEPAFLLAAVPVFGADAGALLVRSTKGRLMGLFPARTARWLGGPAGATVGWTHPYAPLGTPLVDRDEAESVIAAWLDHLARDRSAPACLLLPLVAEQGAFAASLDAVLTRSGRRSAAYERHRRALLAPGAERDGYVDRSVGSRRRKELRRQRHRLEEIAPVTFSTARDAQDIAGALKDFLVIEASGWKGVAGTAAANDPVIRGFVEMAVTGLAASGQARVERLFLNGRAIAAAVTLASGNTAWCWKIAYSEGLASSSPGVQLMLDLTPSLLAESQIARVDSCAIPDHPMIDHIWRERLALCDRLIAVRPSIVPFALACRWETLRRATIAGAKSLRDRLRRS